MAANGAILIGNNEIQKRKERKYLDAFRRILIVKENFAEIYRCRNNETPDFILYVRRGMKKQRIALELTSYVEDGKLNKKGKLVAARLKASLAALSQGLGIDGGGWIGIGNELIASIDRKRHQLKDYASTFDETWLLIHSGNSLPGEMLGSSNFAKIQLSKYKKIILEARKGGEPMFDCSVPPARRHFEG